MHPHMSNAGPTSSAPITPRYGPSAPISPRTSTAAITQYPNYAALSSAPYQQQIHLYQQQQQQHHHLQHHASGLYPQTSSLASPRYYPHSQSFSFQQPQQPQQPHQQQLQYTLSMPTPSLVQPQSQSNQSSTAHGSNHNIANQQISLTQPNGFPVGQITPRDHHGDGRHSLPQAQFVYALQKTPTKPAADKEVSSSYHRYSSYLPTESPRPLVETRSSTYLAADISTKPTIQLESPRAADMTPRTSPLSLRGSLKTGDQLHVIGDILRYSPHVIWKKETEPFSGVFVEMNSVLGLAYTPSDRDAACKLQIHASFGPNHQTFTSDPIRSAFSSSLFEHPGSPGKMTRLLHMKVSGGPSYRFPVTIHPIFDGNASPDSVDCVIQWYRSYPVPNSTDLSYHPIPGATKRSIKLNLDDIDTEFRVSYRIQATKESFMIQIPSRFMSMDPQVEKNVELCISEVKSKFDVLISSQIYTGEGLFKVCPEYLRIAAGRRSLLKSKFEAELELMCNREEPTKMYISQQNSAFVALEFKDSLQLDVALLVARRYLGVKRKSSSRSRSTDPLSARRAGSSKALSTFSLESLKGMFAS